MEYEQRKPMTRAYLQTVGYISKSSYRLNASSNPYAAVLYLSEVYVRPQLCATTNSDQRPSSTPIPQIAASSFVHLNSFFIISPLRYPGTKYPTR
jgi:hypothetical protein